jgi:hypothetical protein
VLIVKGVYRVFPFVFIGNIGEEGRFPMKKMDNTGKKERFP